MNLLTGFLLRIDCPLQERCVYSDLVTATGVPELVTMETSPALQTLDSTMCREVTAQSTLVAVDRLFKATPANQHRAIAMKVHCVVCTVCCY